MRKTQVERRRRVKSIVRERVHHSNGHLILFKIKPLMDDSTAGSQLHCSLGNHEPQLHYKDGLHACLDSRVL
jgi:hypothetical protein